MSKGSVYHTLKKKAERFAKEAGRPSFYSRHRKEMAISAASLRDNPVVRRCRSLIDMATLHHAHGIAHGERVALEGGAILLIECGTAGRQATRDLMVCVQLAGLLHDVKRTEADHTIKGSREAERILRDFEMPPAHKRYVAAAIRNHEAFREVLGSEDNLAKMVSDALYDADKFRWGPDNFTTTLWLILDHAGTPVEELFPVFREKMEGIGRISNTFRTGTGKRYGPEFIEIGLEIGNSIYRELQRIMEAGG